MESELTNKGHKELSQGVGDVLYLGLGGGCIGINV